MKTIFTNLISCELLLLVISLLLISGCDRDDPQPIILYNKAGTIVAPNGARKGDTYLINGTIYTVVDSTMLYESVVNGKDMTKLITTLITNMSGLFDAHLPGYEALETANAIHDFINEFNQDISSWDVSNVTDMSRMFSEATSFNQPIGNWEVDNVTNMHEMFSGCLCRGDYDGNFNQDISQWNVSNVTDMSRMFYVATSFNQPIGNWDVSSVIDMSEMFFIASSFNQSLNNWNVSKVTDMAGMFGYARSFNKSINTWDVSNVTDMAGMFENADSFDQPINNWDVSNVTDMAEMFKGANSFDQPIGYWNVSQVTNMFRMFYNTEWNYDLNSLEPMPMNFNQDLSSWYVSNVTDCAEFSYSINSWTRPKPNFTNCDPN